MDEFCTKLWVMILYSSSNSNVVGSLWASLVTYLVSLEPLRVVIILTRVPGSFILDRVGRRPLIIIGFAGCLVCLAIESAHVATFATPVPDVDPNTAAISAAVAML